MGNRLLFLRWRKLATMRAALVLFAALASQVCSALLPLNLWYLDYTNNVEATDHDVFPLAYPSPEHDRPNNQASPSVVFVRGSETEIEITLQNPNSVASVGTFWFSDACYTGLDSTDVPLSASWSPSSTVTIPPNDMATFTVTLSELPDYVDKGTLSYEFGFSASQGGAIGVERNEPAYLVLAEPCGRMVPVWTDALDLTCEWAHYADTEGEVMALSTWGFHDEVAIGYTIYPGFPARFVGNGGNFRLVDYFEGVEERTGNCWDVSHLMSILSESQGVAPDVLRTSCYVDGKFVTYPIQPIGWFGLERILWTWHQVCRLDGYVYDACTMFPYDLSGQAYGSPPIGFNYQGYWQTENASPPPLNWGLVSRRQAWQDAETEEGYYTIDPYVQDEDVLPLFVTQDYPEVEWWISAAFSHSQPSASRLWRPPTNSST